MYMNRSRSWRNFCREVTKMVLSVFGVSENKQLSEQLANDMMQLTQDIVDTTKKIGETIISGGEKDKDKK